MYCLTSTWLWWSSVHKHFIPYCSLVFFASSNTSYGSHIHGFNGIQITWLAIQSTTPYLHLIHDALRKSRMALEYLYTKIKWNKKYVYIQKITNHQYLFINQFKIPSSTCSHLNHILENRGDWQCMHLLFL